MPYLLIKHEVADFDHWKTMYDKHKSARDHADLHELHLFQNTYNHNEVIVLFEAKSEGKVLEFMESKDLEQAMKGAGVLGTPEMRILREVS
ncbi:hypothetical protein [Pontibacter anaerobius]|uniref:Cyclase n=1 Tax=Pontibacter anaerobius TaxID=2993940 RepID=A0ABT3REP3_9BACT|nr:hypothetical protein [Pontibacter anaerobius]MCX2740333.1 hypothetical protein [Pontibacter anaerobius]